MKKKIVALFSVLVLALSLCACGETKTMKLLALGDTVRQVTVDLENIPEDETLYKLLKRPTYQEKTGVVMDESNPDSPFLTAIMGLEQNPEAGAYISIYCDDVALVSTEDWAVPIEHEGKSYRPTAVGIAELPLKKDITYLFKLITYEG